MRTHPHDDDTLFQVDYQVLEPVDHHPVGPRHTATFARNWLEASDFVRKKYGLDASDRVLVNRVYAYDRSTGVKTEEVFYERYPEGREAPPMPAHHFG
ncbi:hypothetical protein MARCHEWKA_04280 [Brevundimonas phage vB_BpoS-Marchewka]|uniref:Uncharacterized protein n=1 Tax=Brevundimonas phage vB_BpoS-Marchewka TaxID=2948604 RepID=A0A9E7STC1_9CAUD|nr:hypothetical protein MARCHEWKA_04280 [Brevundimonas phage vB_BpoS-Marchewka]UTC29384.1 hypothetical protein BAMBUS_03020 [Brevundimonas phage vB_BpoS-Bambus]